MPNCGLAMCRWWHSRARLSARLRCKARAGSIEPCARSAHCCSIGVSQSVSRHSTAWVGRRRRATGRVAGRPAPSMNLRQAGQRRSYQGRIRTAPAAPYERSVLAVVAGLRRWWGSARDLQQVKVHGHAAKPSPRKAAVAWAVPAPRGSGLALLAHLLRRAPSLARLAGAVRTCPPVPAAARQSRGAFRKALRPGSQARRPPRSRCSRVLAQKTRPTFVESDESSWAHAPRLSTGRPSHHSELQRMM
jgi:hypothetical protein